MRRQMGKSSTENGGDSSSVSLSAPEKTQPAAETTLDHLYSVPETNFRRLLRKCEDMNDRRDYEIWRFEKYVEALEQLLNTFKASLENVKRGELLTDRLSGYDKRVAVLKSIAFPDVNQNENTYRSLLLGDPDSNRPDPSGSVITSQTPTAMAIHHPLPVRELSEELAGVVPVDEPINEDQRAFLAQRVGSQNNSLDAQRAELLNQTVQTSPRVNRDMDMAVTAELDRQGQVTDEILYLAQSLKQNMLTAQQLIKKDFKVIDKATAVADRNALRLDKETEKLAEQNKKNTSWWVLLALIGLFVIFVMMVLFMRLFPKPRAYRGII
ncbi:putative Vesicle transport protein USE1 [Hypsibius exemplaris]|uniref:Vesicle transport protein USE1 n=1 Tax=Hypsibius exemplaris TaxID=2072580 RepID=A0A1W0WRH2_HYPEX|nr:putative Vesicle transport protein USE1 [Hypsibius exemplaris]